MMTFEEFFLKKKIDLEDLAKSKPELYTEFRTHFEQMSEKSFDHTKKYWFNQLRHEFPLSEEKETMLKEAFKPKEIPSTPVAEEIKELASSPKPSGFKPRFKAANLAESEKPKAESGDIKEEKTEAPTSKPPGFKPRFKAGQTQQAESEKPKAEGEDIKEEKTEAPTSKPAGFKPRFKAGQTSVKKDDTSEK